MSSVGLNAVRVLTPRCFSTHGLSANHRTLVFPSKYPCNWRELAYPGFRYLSTAPNNWGLAKDSTPTRGRSRTETPRISTTPLYYLSHRGYGRETISLLSRTHALTIAKRQLCTPVPQDETPQEQKSEHVDPSTDKSDFTLIRAPGTGMLTTIIESQLMFYKYIWVKLRYDSNLDMKSLDKGSVFAAKTICCKLYSGETDDLANFMERKIMDKVKDGYQKLSPGQKALFDWDRCRKMVTVPLGIRITDGSKGEKFMVVRISHQLMYGENEFDQAFERLAKEDAPKFLRTHLWRYFSVTIGLKRQLHPVKEDDWIVNYFNVSRSTGNPFG